MTPGPTRSSAGQHPADLLQIARTLEFAHADSYEWKVGNAFGRWWPTGAIGVVAIGGSLLLSATAPLAPQGRFGLGSALLFLALCLLAYLVVDQRVQGLRPTLRTIGHYIQFTARATILGLLLLAIHFAVVILLVRFANPAAFPEWMNSFGGTDRVAVTLLILLATAALLPTATVRSRPSLSYSARSRNDPSSAIGPVTCTVLTLTAILAVGIALTVLLNDAVPDPDWGSGATYVAAGTTVSAAVIAMWVPLNVAASKHDDERRDVVALRWLDVAAAAADALASPGDVKRLRTPLAALANLLSSRVRPATSAPLVSDRGTLLAVEGIQRRLFDVEVPAHSRMFLRSLRSRFDPLDRNDIIAGLVPYAREMAARVRTDRGLTPTEYRATFCAWKDADHYQI